MYKRKRVRRRRVRRRALRRFKRKFNKRVNVNRSLQPYSQRYLCRLKYNQTVVVNGTGCLEYQFNLNSIYDPDLSGTGHQPYGFDQLATVYNRYRVYKTVWRIQGVSKSTDYNLCTYPANDLVTVSNINRAAELPRAISKLVCLDTPTYLVGRISLPSLFGRTRYQYMSDDRYQSLVSANPSESAILRVFVQDTLGPVGNVSAILMITLIYYVELFDSNTLSQS